VSNGKVNVFERIGSWLAWACALAETLRHLPHP